MLDAFRVLGPRSLQRILLFGFGPIGEHLASKFLKLPHRHSFRFISSCTVGDRLIHLIGNLLQSPIRMWPIGEALVQSFCSPFFFTQFIAHELLYLYIFRACTISKLRILTGTFSHTHRQPQALRRLELSLGMNGPGRQSRRRRLELLPALESQAGQSGFRGGFAFEIGPAMPLEIVELADPAQFQILPGRPADDRRMFLATLFQQTLALGEVIKRNCRVDVMGGVVHDVIEEPFDGERENDVRRAFELHVVKRPLLRVVIPRQPGMSVLNE